MGSDLSALGSAFGGISCSESSGIDSSFGVSLGVTGSLISVVLLETYSAERGLPLAREGALLPEGAAFFIEDYSNKIQKSLM